MKIIKTDDLTRTIQNLNKNNFRDISLPATLLKSASPDFLNLHQSYINFN